MTLFSTFGLFIALSALVTIILAVIVLVPWLRSSSLKNNPVDNQLLDINVVVFRERLAELQTDKDNGIIDESHYQNQKLELERQLLDAQREVLPMVAPNIKSRLILAGWVPVLAAMAYVVIARQYLIYGRLRIKWVKLLMIY